MCWPLGTKHFDSFVLLSESLRHKFPKKSGRRRTLRRQTPTSFPYKFIMNIGHSFLKFSSPISPNTTNSCIDAPRIRDASIYSYYHPCKYVLTACIIFDRTTHTYPRDVFNVSSKMQRWVDDVVFSSSVLGCTIDYRSSWNCDGVPHM